MVDGAIILDWTFPTKKLKSLLNEAIRSLSLIEPLSIGIFGKFSWITVAVPRRQLSNLSMWVQKVLLLSGPEKGYDSQERLAVSTRELTRFGIPYEIIKAILPNLLAMRLLKILSQPQTEPVDVLLLMMKWRLVSINMLQKQITKWGKTFGLLVLIILN